MISHHDTHTHTHTHSSGKEHEWGPCSAACERSFWAAASTCWRKFLIPPEFPINIHLNMCVRHECGHVCQRTFTSQCLGLCVCTDMLVCLPSVSLRCSLCGDVTQRCLSLNCLCSRPAEQSHNLLLPRIPAADREPLSACLQHQQVQRARRLHPFIRPDPPLTHQRGGKLTSCCGSCLFPRNVSCVNSRVHEGENIVIKPDTQVHLSLFTS